MKNKIYIHKFEKWLYSQLSLNIILNFTNNKIQIIPKQNIYHKI